MESLKNLFAFVHAAEQGSYVGAGRVLGISSSGVAKSVARLEADVGVRLFHRTTRSIRLTPEGEHFYARSKRIIDEVLDMRTAISATRERPQGRLRLSVPHIVGHHLLMPLLPEFLRLYPEIELDVDFDDRVVDLINEGIDVAIRSGDLSDTRFIARPLGPQHFVICASREYFACHGAPKTPDNLIQHRCIRFRYPSSRRLAKWSFGASYHDLKLPENLIFNNTDAGMRAAIDGMGLAHLPVYVAAEAINSGILQPVLTDFMRPQQALSLIWPSNRQLSPKVRAFVDYITEGLQANAKIFAACSSSIHSQS
ncbi:TPA: LysR family transcriptional regulator [Enterobacter hormaechei subsp. xiangfangensis]|nr:LysR family transcriptional regulator [Enterobacter hormaechei]HCM9170236.1 LysR family transcriptional regulator [Enterobacter hormaechei subsp. xiangfangensis]